MSSSQLPRSFSRIASEQSVASRDSNTTTSSSKNTKDLLQLHTRTGSFADIVLKFSELTQDLASCSSKDHTVVDAPKKNKMKAVSKVAEISPLGAVECECIEVDEKECLRTAYELYRV